MRVGGGRRQRGSQHGDQSPGLLRRTPPSSLSSPHNQPWPGHLHCSQPINASCGTSAGDACVLWHRAALCTTASAAHGRVPHRESCSARCLLCRPTSPVRLPTAEKASRKSTGKGQAVVLAEAVVLVVLLAKAEAPPKQVSSWPQSRKVPLARPPSSENAQGAQLHKEQAGHAKLK